MSVLREDALKLIEEIASDKNMKHFVLTVKEELFSGNNYLGEITRVNITDTELNKSLNLLLKISPESKITREGVPLSTYYHREIYAYTNVLPVLDRFQEVHGIPIEDRFSFAKFYKGITDEFKEMVILKDLSCHGFQMHDRNSPLDYEHTELVIKTLAQIHATSFVLKKKDPSLFAKLTEVIANSMNYGELVTDCVENIAIQLLPKLACQTTRSKLESNYKSFSEKLHRILDSKSSEPYNVICHGDCWNNNLLFKYSDGQPSETIFVDWQIIRLASPITDISYFIFTATDKPFREKHFKHLLDVYYKTLKTNVRKMGCDIRECYPKEVFQQQVKEMMVFGLILSLCVVPVALRKPGEEENLETLLNEANRGNYEYRMNDDAVSRLCDIVTDFVKFDLDF